MNDSLLYFLFYTAGCFGIGFAVGGLYESRKASKVLDKMYEAYRKQVDEMEELYEKRLASLGKRVDDGHNNSEHVPTYTA